jgi:hypothetical protein
MKSEHLQWIVPLAIAFFAVMFFIDRSLIEDGEVRVHLLEHKVEILEKEIDKLKQ